MQLSVCMIVKNEEKNLERCLESLTELINAIDSELIIVDTGSTDKTVEIAKKYTQKVYFHEWNNNFSDMRNISISYAKGEWILIIDADECIENSDEIINTFKSDKIGKYNTLAVTVKNITNIKTNDFGNIISPRIFRNTGNFKYIGKVHNEPVVEAPILILQNTVFVHYGYVSNDKELMEYKFNRTKNLLLEVLEEQPDNIYYNYQLAVTYAMHNDYKLALEQMKKTYSLIEDRGYNKKDYVYIYYEFASYYYYAGDYDKFNKMISLCEEGLNLEPKNMDLWYMLGKVYCMIDENKKSVEAYHQYINLYKNLNNMIVSKMFDIKFYSVSKYSEVLHDMVVNCFKLKRDDDFEKYLYEIDDEKYLDSLREVVIEFYLEKDKIEELYKYYKTKLYNSEKDVISNFIISLEEKLLNYSKDISERVYNIFSYDNDSYAYLNQVRLNYMRGNKEASINMGKAYLNKFDINNEPDYFGDFLYYLLNEKLFIEDISLANKIMEKTFKRFVSYVVRKNEDINKALIENYMQIKNYDFNSIRLKKILGACIIAVNINDKSKLQQFFKDYIFDGINYIKYIYSQFVFDNNLLDDIKNNEDKFFFVMNQAFTIKETDMKKYLALLRDALTIAPEYSKGIEFLIEEINNQNIKEKNEMENLKQQFINNINILLDCGNYDDAQELIEQVEEIIGEDIDIVMLKTKLKLAKTKENKLLN